MQWIVQAGLAVVLLIIGVVHAAPVMCVRAMNTPATRTLRAAATYLWRSGGRGSSPSIWKAVLAFRQWTSSLRASTSLASRTDRHPWSCTASQSYLSLPRLGFDNVRVHTGSMLEYALDAAAPLTRGAAPK